MNGGVLMQVEVDAALRTCFEEAAAREHRATDQVLGRLMREYVAHERHPTAVEDRNLEAWARQQHGWRSSPFGGD